MYAIIENGSKQYRVKEGDIIEVELLKEEKTVTFNNVLLFQDGSKVQIGTPYLKDFSVTGAILEQIQGPKVIAFKYKRRKNYRRKKGHRQKYLKIKITKIKHGT